MEDKVEILTGWVYKTDVCDRFDTEMLTQDQVWNMWGETLISRVPLFYLPTDHPEEWFN